MDIELFLLCVTIFLMRVVDVSLGTIQTFYLVKNQKKMATLFGFIDVLVWFLMVRKAITTSNESLWIALAYAGGYAAGTYLGSVLSDKLIAGQLSLKVVLSKKDDAIVDTIRSKGYAVTVMNALGKDDEKYMLLMEVDKKKYSELKNIITKLDPNAYIVTTDTQYIQNGYIK